MIGAACYSDFVEDDALEIALSRQGLWRRVSMGHTLSIQPSHSMGPKEVLLILIISLWFVGRR
jgi:hypothetical protein